MATSINGTLRLSYGNHTHNENFDSTSDPYTFSNTSGQYSAGGARAVYSASTGVALDTGTIDPHEGLLLIKNVNTFGPLMVSMDTGANWDIKIKAGHANLISVGPDHPVHVKTDIADRTNQSVSSVTTTGGIVFTGSIPEAGTYVMTANASPDNTTSGPSFIMQTEVNSTTIGKVYELNGTTRKDLATGSVYTAATHVNLASVADYRFTLTEA